MKTTEEKAQQILAALKRSVEEALDKKRRLGQYAVVWDGEKVVRILPTDKTGDKTGTLRSQPKP